MTPLAETTLDEVQEFLVLEAALLDDWELPKWREMFTAECRYLVPNMAGDPYADPENTLFLIADDGHHLTERVKRLGKKTAHAEYPHSLTQRLVSNIRIVSRAGISLKVQSSFVTYRSSHGITDTYFGRHEYLMVKPDGRLLITEKRTILKMGALRPHGKLSIIV